MEELPKQENHIPKSVNPRLKLKDRKIRLVLIPLLGIGISNITRIYNGLETKDLLFWAGHLYFIILSFLIWHGNRYFLIEQRRHFDWFNHPVRKVSILLFANIFYTTPVTIAFLYGWYVAVPGVLPDWNKIALITIINVLCVIFITHIYETVYLIQQRQTDLLNFEKLERARTQAELDALKNQVDPHFMFNCLNTLGYLIENSPKQAVIFNQNLSDIFRYILMTKNNKLVLLKDEMAFLNKYFSLIKIRFGNGVRLSYADLSEYENQILLPPVSLQTLVENAIKHNDFSDKNPLNVEIIFRDNEIIVSNLINPGMTVRNSTGTGLKNLGERYFLLTGKNIRISKKDKRFEVVLPFLTTSL